jgi:D-beta-D-heptose 7-phosphate kinase/D-beta-D-heptose 1-phosphate adenosyltransferase
MNIIVIGDIMVDINFYSKIERNAPEAALPIYDIINTNYILGGAANVAQNLHNLGTNMELVGVIGHDDMGRKIKNLLQEKNMKHLLLVDETRKTTQKNRIFHNDKLMARFDIEDNHDISPQIEKQIFDLIINKKDINAIIISDYNKGIITLNLCQQIIKYGNENNIYTFVDPKVKHTEKYKNCFCFKPNLNEGEIITGKKNIEHILETLKDKINSTHIVLTSGEKGIYVNNAQNNIRHETDINVVDVTGAGDIVLCVLVYIYLQEKDIYISSLVANYIAGKSVQTIGNYIFSSNDIQEYFHREKTNKIFTQNKIIYDYEIDKIKELSKKSRIVFTNGCFDIIHSAHIQNLQFAKQQGDTLIVGLNTDDSIKRLKGQNRPINNIEERSKLLSLFDFIDYIIVFRDDTPLNIIQLLNPFRIVKGGDYKKEDIIGIEYCQNVVLFNYIEGKSSTIIINKILQK